ncbi:MAG TPA: CRISPR-associated helicase Cas3' [Armatimonadota bacterium]|nr:CRISPR-associated helicase Cas3' [Armatimonadota bacterium]
MVPDLATGGGSDPFDVYLSHPDKTLRVHTEGVVAGVRRRTAQKLPQTAALFHDFGKLNPNFQLKLDGPHPLGYSNHAYLSAHAFLAFCQSNPRAARRLGIANTLDILTAVAIIAHHHGNLPNMSSILSLPERERLAEFLTTEPHLPMSGFLQGWFEHTEFDAIGERSLLDRCAILREDTLKECSDRLDLFLETQAGFAALIEADKRDAGNNNWLQREEQLAWAEEHFSASLNNAISTFRELNPLNLARTAVREQAVESLGAALTKGERVFTLTAPTGAGKTYALLALANRIREDHPEQSILYALPFLTITEQVEDICRKDIFPSEPLFVTRIDSRAEDEELAALLAALETAPERAGELMKRSFSRSTFDAGFIITTFVQLFETLLSNRGSTLLRLPNLGKRIFLLDEIQALPPRLYVFFTAFLRVFCEKHDSFAILSTATMPALSLPEKKIDDNEDPRKLFPGYEPPKELLDPGNFFGLPVFDRYEIRRVPGTTTLPDLAKLILRDNSSCLVILNTIDDTRRLYDLLHDKVPREGLVLLNTRFILNDRRAHLAKCKTRLSAGERTVLISTQLIEAGADVDFPVAFRDLCPLPSLIQSAGRCNRNGKPKRGIVWFFELVGDKGESRGELVYRDPADGWILQFVRDAINGSISEKNLLHTQRDYFNQINLNLSVGTHRLTVDGRKESDNLIRRITELAFETVGSFRLIDEDAFGKELRYYVPACDQDLAWEELQDLTIEAARAGGDRRLPYEEAKQFQIKIDLKLRSMAGRVVALRVWNERDAPPAEKRRGEVKEVCGLRKLLLPEIHYSSRTGIETKGGGVAIL